MGVFQEIKLKVIDVNGDFFANEEVYVEMNVL